MEDKSFTEKVIERLYSLAKQKNIKICDLEAEMQFTTGYLRKIKKNNSFISAYAIKRAADFLGVTVDYLLSEEQERANDDENKVLADYFYQIMRLTDTYNMTWNYENWDESVERVFGGRESTRLDDEGIKFPFFTIDRYNPEDRDSEYCRYVESVHGSYQADVEGTYYAKIPNRNLFLVVVETFYDGICEDCIPDVLLTDGKFKYSTVAIGMDYCLGMNEENECVFPAIEKLYMSIKNQWRSNNGWLSRQTREELNSQLQMFSQIKMSDE